jgi:hypothetical protein
MTGVFGLRFNFKTKTMTVQEREKQVAMGFVAWIYKEVTDADWDTFKRNEWYKSIPPADDLRQRIEAKLKEVRSEMILHPLGSHRRLIEILEQLLKP